MHESLGALRVWLPQLHSHCGRIIMRAACVAATAAQSFWIEGIAVLNKIVGWLKTAGQSRAQTLGITSMSFGGGHPQTTLCFHWANIAVDLTTCHGLHQHVPSRTLRPMAEQRMFMTDAMKTAVRFFLDWAKQAGITYRKGKGPVKVWMILYNPQSWMVLHNTSLPFPCGPPLARRTRLSFNPRGASMPLWGSLGSLAFGWFGKQ